MKVKKSKQPSSSTKKVQTNLRPSYYIIMMAYALVPVFTPNFNTFDSNGPKFLAIALINLVAFLVISLDPNQWKGPDIRIRFFKNPIGIAYSLLLLFSLISFFSAINISESVLNFSKILTIFTSAYVLYLIFSSNRGYLEHLAVALTVLLIFDSLTVFYNMLLYISRDVSSIMDIKSVYSHKNILGSAIFLKIPFALCLVLFSNGWKKTLGYMAGMSALLATLLLSTRAFYLGIVFLLAALFIYMLIRHIVAGKKGYFLTMARWAGLFVLAIVLYTLAQQIFFPKNTDTIWNTSIISRLSSINSQESSTHARLGAWNRSVKLIGEHPIMGVGTGNWKVDVLQYENLQLPDFTYMNKNHNDFLEITAETGLPGGLAYLSIFVFILNFFLKISLNPSSEGENIKLLFLPAFGILAYSVDAFFNFPADRPEIQSMFAIFVAAGVTFSNELFSFRNSGTGNPPARLTGKFPHSEKAVAAVVLIPLIITTIILFLYCQSLYYQRIVEEDLADDNLQNTSAYIIRGFPVIPNISVYGEPIVVSKARYLIKENKYDDAINFLKADHASPFDTRREFFMAMAYIKKGMTDSAVSNLRQVYRYKPLYGKGTNMLASLLYNTKKQDEAMNVMDNFARLSKTNSTAWLRAAYMHWQTGSHEKSIELLDSALVYLPGNTEILSQRKQLEVAP
ncbi:MAG: O-antigen ligase family protein [bacterium]